MANPTPPVTIQSGTLTGAYDKAGDIAIFKGIPFAQPPVGELRWKPPQPAAPWDGILKAEKVTGQAIQQAAGFEEFMDRFVEGQGWGRLKSTAMKLILKVAPAPKQSEDCLSLTIRTPSLDKDARLPVMVWIHGGDFQHLPRLAIFPPGVIVASQRPLRHRKSGRLRLTPGRYRNRIHSLAAEAGRRAVPEGAEGAAGATAQRAGIADEDIGPIASGAAHRVLAARRQLQIAGRLIRPNAPDVFVRSAQADVRTVEIHSPASSGGCPETSRREANQVFILPGNAADGERTRCADEQVTIRQQVDGVDVFAVGGQANIGAIEVPFERTRCGAAQGCRDEAYDV